MIIVLLKPNNIENDRIELKKIGNKIINKFKKKVINNIY